MGRRFRSDRLYRIIKILVNGIAIISLILGMILLVNKKEDDLFYLNEFNKCASNPAFKDVKRDFCYMYLDMMNENERFLTIYWSVGILLPITFYGGSKLTNYIFPKNKIA